MSQTYIHRITKVYPLMTSCICRPAPICAIVSGWHARIGVADFAGHGAFAWSRFGSFMLAYIVRRLWQMLPTMAGVVLLVFMLFNWVGGDPAYLLAGKMADANAI